MSIDTARGTNPDARPKLEADGILCRALVELLRWVLGRENEEEGGLGVSG